MEEEQIALRDSCGVMGMVKVSGASAEVKLAQTIYYGLVALQHRGQEGSGIVTAGDNGGVEFKYHKGVGLVDSVFTKETLDKLEGKVGIGHNRYSTTGGSDPINLQPFVVHTCHGPLAIAHNGELINAASLRAKVQERGVGLSTHSDSELLCQLLSLTPPRSEKHGPRWASRIRHLMEATPLSYSVVMLHKERLFAFRDPFGNRPLCMGKIVSKKKQKTDGEDEAVLAWIVASESCVFQSARASYVREILPGEIVELTPDGVRTLDIVSRPKVVSETRGNFKNVQKLEDSKPAFCIFEYIYFARHDTILEGQQVYGVRYRCGIQLAKEATVVADIVSTVPESATPAALGYSHQSGIPYAEVFCKNRYVGRSFIQPDKKSRSVVVQKKFGTLTENIAGKRIVLIDDSIVRGNTAGPIVRLLRDGGAKEVHLRIASPSVKHPCYMGINIPSTEELIAGRLDLLQIKDYMDADSLVYLSIEGLVEAVLEKIPKGDYKPGHCTACFSGCYPCSLEW